MKLLIHRQIATTDGRIMFVPGVPYAVMEKNVLGWKIQNSLGQSVWVPPTFDAEEV